ncbi:glycosyl transferase family 1 [Dulcicalothrix desertica PCC 7102]|uniref:Glycosyl transferase family 1 n=1 Tax=Dulcicalothrix desertica PCC 7102 TaxID=232991 RepID=A0A3S1AGY2_9CYAN|nr:glycosyltransferase [Dulcicalothrix desertica]RUT00248.1 glycosyl transferase family 1 [Dulcicalothrix desertica PCC 7102]TWH55715.1 Glycosyltransferase [Dulcicalothrix desertica PCC 7102]
METSKNTRVLFVSQAYVVGVNQGKLNAIAETGKAEVGLLVPSNWKALEWNRQFVVETPYPKIKVYTAPVMFSGRGGAYVFNPLRIWQVIKDFQPDIIQVEQEVFSLCALEFAICSRITGKPLALFGWENMERILSAPRRWVSNFVMDTVKLMLPGNHDGANLMRKWGYTGLMEIIPQIGVDTQLFAPKATKTQNEVFNIGFLGRLVPEKGVDTIFAAVRHLLDKGLKCQITICGTGYIEEALRSEAQKLQITDSIIWRGGIRHDQAPSEISNFDVLVLPSRTAATWKEQFGHVLIEAMAMGVPVIGSDSGEIPRVIGRDDLVFPEDNAIALAAILERMIHEPNWWQEVGKFGSNIVQQNYTHQRIAQRLISLWEIILKGKYTISPTKSNEAEVKQCV